MCRSHIRAVISRSPTRHKEAVIIASDVNVVSLVGRLTKDVELRTTPSGMEVASVRLAFSSSKKVGDRWEDKSNFIDVTLSGGTAEAAAQYVHKGSQVAVQGRLDFQEWKADDGTARSKHAIIADRFQFLGSKGDASADPGDRGGDRYEEPPSDVTPRASAAKKDEASRTDDDPIPF